MRYCVYGLTLFSPDFPLEKLPPAPADIGPEVHLRLGAAPPSLSCTDDRLVYRSFAADGSLFARLYRWPDCALLKMEMEGDFFFDLQKKEIAVAPRSGRLDRAKVALLGPVLACWLTLHGRFPLHASAVVDPEGGGHVFIAHAGSGKSSLAAAALKKGGKLLTDDILAFDPDGESVMGYPGYPQMKFWPDAFQVFFPGETQDPLLPEIPKLCTDKTESFWNQPAPLRALYLLENRPDAPSVALSLIQGHDAVFQLLNHSFISHHLNPRELASQLELYSNLARRVPVFRLSYPRRWNQLGKVVEAIFSSKIPAGRTDASDR